MVGVEKHPDREPGRAEAVDSGNDDDGNCDQQFEGKRIYDFTSVKKIYFSWRIRTGAKRPIDLPKIRRDRSCQVNRSLRSRSDSPREQIFLAYEDLVGEVSTGYPAFTQALVPPITLIKLV